MNKQADLISKAKNLIGIPTADQGEDMMTHGIASDLVKGVSHKPTSYSATPAKDAVIQGLSKVKQEPSWKQRSPAPVKVNWGSREAVSALLNPIRKITGSPLGMAAGLGLVGAGLGYGLWHNIVNTGGSLGRLPITKMTGMTDDEYDEAMEEIANDKRYKWILPGALGLLLGGGYLAFRAPSSYTKFASMGKQADELFSYGGYVPEIDFHKVINAGAAKDMFTNDPKIAQQPYVKNMGLAILNDAANRAGYVNPTLGNIYDSTVQKMKSKLTLQGVTGVAANTMIANATAHLLTGAIGAVVPLPKEVKRNIIDAGTWATAITSILT